MRDSVLDPYQNLANAIVLAAVKDYRKALKKLKKHPKNTTAKDEVDELERFFHSRLYSIYTNVDPEYLISKLRKEVE